MTAKEKAKELFDVFYEVYPNTGVAIESAKASVNEIINCDSCFKTLEDSKEFVSYWYEVQQEINKL